MPEAGMTRREPSSWAVGFTGFAAFTLIIVGFFHAITGFAAILGDDIFVATPNYIFQLNITTWGWVHMLVGLIVVAAGFALFSGAIWARTIGVILAVGSAIVNFAFLPYQPIWSTLIIAIDIAVIWALTAHGRDITME